MNMCHPVAARMVLWQLLKQQQWCANCRQRCMHRCCNGWVCVRCAGACGAGGHVAGVGIGSMVVLLSTAFAGRAGVSTG